MIIFVNQLTVIDEYTRHTEKVITINYLILDLQKFY